MTKRFLPGLTSAEFLRRHWQKAPLFAPGALAGYIDAISREQLFELATRDDVESRCIIRERGGQDTWDVRHGPFSPAALRRLPKKDWTLLVQGVDVLNRQAARLLREFDFLPHARLDDVMVSYAAPGGGVGPHFDSYDVFLVQTTGSRRWQISAQAQLDLIQGAPLKLLSNFKPERTEIAAPGNVLYLPPQFAHDGVAVDHCITCSVGFRAPAAHELAARFLDHLADTLSLDGLYTDHDLAPTRHPGELPRALLDYADHSVAKLRWTSSDLTDFLGRYLTEPKAHVVFSRPLRRLNPARFAEQVRKFGIRLAPASRMLYRGRRFYLNGERVGADSEIAAALRDLADRRELPADFDCNSELLQLLRDWHAAGYVEISR